MSGRACWECDKPTRRICKGYDWYSYPDIRFCQWQIKWVIQHEKVLGDGKWPADPVETGYVGGSSTQLKAEGKQIKPAYIRAEVYLRLAATKTDGDLLEAQIRAGDAVLKDAAYCALIYCSGWRRKHMTYPAWARKWNYRRKFRSKVSCVAGPSKGSYIWGRW